VSEGLLQQNALIKAHATNLVTVHGFCLFRSYLMKTCLHVSNGGEAGGFVSYLQPGSASSTFDGRMDLEALVRAFEFRTSRYHELVALQYYGSFSE
jgi:hypothetical protein